jgi:hypothetical protein
LAHFLEGYEGKRLIKCSAVDLRSAKRTRTGKLFILNMRVSLLRLALLSGASLGHTAGRKISDHSHLVSMRLECLSGLKQRLQAGKNTWPSIGTGSVSGVILGPLVMRHCYFGGFGLGQQFDSCA